MTLDYGIESLALSGSDPGDIRTAALSRLENENDSLRVICTVNILATDTSRDKMFEHDLKDYNDGQDCNWRTKWCKGGKGTCTDAVS